MKKNDIWKVLVVFAASAIFVSGVVLYVYGGTGVEKGVSRGEGKGVISLMPPPFIGVAGAAESAGGGGGAGGGGAFPEDEAGICAYINTGQTTDIEKIKTIFTEVKEVGDNYIIGITPISDLGGDIDVHVYADTSGWIVAYFTKDEPESKIMQWGTIDRNNPDIGVITSTTLRDAIYKAGNAAGVGIISENIGYYDFKYPDATAMMIFVRTRASDGSNFVQIEIPATYTLYNAYYYHYGYDLRDSKVKVDGTTVSDLPSCGGCWTRAFGSYGGAITAGKLHKIEIYYNERYGGSAGVATVLIYSPA